LRCSQRSDAHQQTPAKYVFSTKSVDSGRSASKILYQKRWMFIERTRLLSELRRRACLPVGQRNRVPQEAVGRPGQIGDLCARRPRRIDYVRLHPFRCSSRVLDLEAMMLRASPASVWSAIAGQGRPNHRPSPKVDCCSLASWSRASAISFLRHARRISCLQRRASETSARPPCFPDSLPAPPCVGAFAEALTPRLMPEVIGAIIRPTRLLLEQIRALANDLVQTRLRLCQRAMRISVWGQLAAAADVHLGVQTLEFLVGD
jgi:hypothetical protein